jgi:hypothetical protein
MISKVTTTSVKINSRYIETSSNCGKMDNSNNNNADEPPPPGITSGHRENSSNNNNNSNSKHAIHNKCESLDEGTFAFMHWMNSDNKKSITSDNPIILLKFVNDKHTILYDTDLHIEVDVEINAGVPYCRHCKLDDCSHVGFAVCVEELYGHRRGRGKEETVDDIVSEN